MIDLPEGLPIELTPLAFLVGTWQGEGKVVVGEEEVDFTQTMTFEHDGHSALKYSSTTSLVDGTLLPSELGFWRIKRSRGSEEYGPGLTPPVSPTPIKLHEDLEEYRHEEGGFLLQVSMLHPSGMAELYKGEVKQGRIQLATEHGAAFEGARIYNYSTRLYGIVEGDLFWVWDIAMKPGEAKSHASAALKRVK